MNTLKILVGAAAGLLALGDSAVNAESDCEKKCSETCASSAGDCPQEYCVSADGALPTLAQVDVSDQWVTLGFQWDVLPAVTNDKALEFSLSIDHSDPYLEPFDGADIDPNVGVVTDLPCWYRDVYNHTAGTVGDVYAGLVNYCTYPENLDTLALAVYSGPSNFPFALSSKSVILQSKIAPRFLCHRAKKHAPEKRVF
jgi:hypothetical protein